MSISEAIDMLRLVDPVGADTAQEEWENLEEEKEDNATLFSDKEDDYNELEEKFNDLVDVMDTIRDYTLEALKEAEK